MGGLDTVLSAGTYTIKAGYADVNETTLLPSIEVPSKVKRDGKGSGAENGAHGGVSQLMDGAEVKDWDGLEVVLRYILYEQLGWIQGEEGNILMAEPYGTSRVRVTYAVGVRRGRTLASRERPGFCAHIILRRSSFVAC